MEPVLIEGYHSFTTIGYGGFSTVYLAEQEIFDRRVAVKVLHSDLRDPAAERRFVRECRATGRLTGHPHIITVFDAGTTRDHRPYLTMEYFAGGSLADALKNRGRLPVSEATALCLPIADALATAHEHGILHRDLKPANILLRRTADPVLSDFGIASVTEGMEAGTMSAAFTPGYAAPEVLLGEDPGTAADIFALGATLFTLVQGTTPFPGRVPNQILQRILAGDVAPLDRADVPDALRDLLAWSLAARPEQRPGSAREFAAALAELDPTATRAAAWASQPPPPAVPVPNLGPRTGPDGPGGPGGPGTGAPPDEHAGTDDERTAVAAVGVAHPPAAPSPPAASPPGSPAAPRRPEVGAVPVPAARADAPRPAEPAVTRASGSRWRAPFLATAGVLAAVVAVLAYLVIRDPAGAGGADRGGAADGPAAASKVALDGPQALSASPAATSPPPFLPPATGGPGVLAPQGGGAPRPPGQAAQPAPVGGTGTPAAPAPAPAMAAPGPTAGPPATAAPPGTGMGGGAAPAPGCAARAASITDYRGRVWNTRYDCATYVGSALYANVAAGTTAALDDSGYMNKASTVWAICQVNGRANPVVQGNTNTWWLYTEGDGARANAPGYSGAWGYLPATVVKGGGQNEPIPGVPTCSGYL
ncbi:Serine/threonine protein kinase [Frankia canadensis]|uniref:non-specific serine/threonine protein kinase n=1 Tax=Frankia canadensis TaxID=1836972 RepID=A0A2I2KX68_9ACTN|nr:serine/threonine-protein kinase [Frankia canadensis]SNQ50258.1 Serine/threonine protein kinase [Frankia canadensis]SOU57548.1 Serine/threonine protein kinase [Frankia canadensis]